MFPRRRPVAPAAVEHRDSCGGQGQHQEQRGSGNDRDRGGGGAFPPAEAAAKAECSSWTLQQGFATASGEEPAWASRRVRERRTGGAAKGLGEPRSEVRGAAPALREGQAAAEGSEAADGVRAAWRGAAHAQEGGAAGRCISGWLGLPEARGAAGPEMTAWGRGRQGRCRKRRGCEEHRGHCTTGTARRGGRTRAARPSRWLQHWTSSGLQRWAARLLAACTLDHCRLGADAGREERRRGRRGGTSG